MVMPLTAGGMSGHGQSGNWGFVIGSRVWCYGLYPAITEGRIYPISVRKHTDVYV